MREHRDNLQYLADMLEHARAAVRFTASYTEETYFDDQLRRFALLHAVQIIGEAAKKVDASVKDSLPDIPWAQIIGCRNVIAHDYDEIEDPLVWRIVADHLPALIDRLEGFFKAKGIVV
ncbi:MAG: DUF86 domain-containing protein [Holosporales bacterium]|jgi:uncharacterized protein with HEPN domain